MKNEVVLSLLVLFIRDAFTGDTITFSQDYVEAGENFTVTCEVESNNAFASIKRADEVCFGGCGEYLACCNERNVSGNCHEASIVSTTFSAAVIDDFTEWSCYNSDDLLVSKHLKQFVETTLKYQQQQEEIIKDETYSYVCKAEDGEPWPVLKWYLNGTHETDNVYDYNTTDGENITNFSNFNLTAHAGLQGQILYCEAEQLSYQDKVTAGDLKLNVLFSPVKATGQPITGVVNQAVILKCTVEDEDKGNPDSYNFTWTRENDETFHKTTLDGQLDFTPTSVNDDDTYYCEPRNKVGTGLPGSITFTVNSPPIRRSPVDGNYRVFYTDDLDINCTVEGRPDLKHIQWNITTDVGNIFLSKEGNKWLEGKLYLSSTILNWNPEDQEDRHLGNGKVVTCYADNDVGIPVSHPVTMNIEFEPGKAQLELSIDKINVENQLNLTCNLDKPGNPGAHAHYFANDKDYENNIPGNVDIIQITDIDKEGMYRCAGINEPYNKGDMFGETSDGQLLTVIVPPKIFDPIEAKLVNPIYGEDFVLVCVAAAKPEVEISWYKDDATILPDNGYFDSPNETTTPITDYFHGLTKAKRSNLTWTPPNKEAVTCESVTIYDGVYTCKAETEEDSHITVQSSTITLQTSYPPIWTGNNSFVAEMNSSIFFTCSVCALPAVDDNSYKWYKEGVLKEGETEKELHIQITSKTDFGMYECEPTNPVDSNRFPINLTESGRPFINNFTSSLNVTSTVVPLSWVIGTEGGHGPLIFTLWGQTGDDDTKLICNDILQYGPEGGTMFYDVIDQTPGADIKFILRARNGRGNEPFSDNETAIALTRMSPVVDLAKVDVDDSKMVVYWSYVPNLMEKSLDQSYYCTLCIKYRLEEDDNDKATIHPSEDNCSIDALLPSETIAGSFQRKKKYVVEIYRVYENGYNCSNGGTQTKVESYPDPNLDPGGVAAISVFLILAIAIVVFVLLVFLNVIPKDKILRRKRGQQRGSNRQQSLTTDTITDISDIQGGPPLPVAYNPYADINIDSLQPKEEAVDELNGEAVDELNGEAVDELNGDYPILCFQTEENLDAIKKKKLEAAGVVIIPKSASGDSSVSDPSGTSNDYDNKPHIRPNKTPRKPKTPDEHHSFPSTPFAKPVITYVTEKKVITDVEKCVSFTAHSTTHGQIRWLFNDTDISPSKQIKTFYKDGNYTFKLYDARREDSGKYTLEVITDDGSSTIQFYAVVIGKLDFTGIDVSYLDEDDDMEIYGSLPDRFLS